MPFARAADHVVVVSGGSFPLLQLVPHRIDALRGAGCAVSLVVVGPTAWPPEEVAEFAGVDVLAVLPRIAARRDDIGAMRTSAWRPWWHRVEGAAAYLAAAGAPREPAVAP
jgi:methylmalonyl-CoA mutase cobalamin-binding subunit